MGQGSKLSQRERQVSRLAAQGLSNKEIGDALDISTSSVGTYLSRALTKLGVSRRSELPLLYQESVDPQMSADSAVKTVQATNVLTATLTAAQREVLAAVRLGKSNKEIAYERGCSIRTVANLLANAYRKLGVHSRTEAVAVTSDD